jgi:hypothetical protein
LPLIYGGAIYLWLARGYPLFPFGIAIASLIVAVPMVLWEVGYFAVTRFRRAVGMDRLRPCPKCHGTGSVPGLLWGTNQCEDCGGKGQVWPWE